MISLQQFWWEILEENCCGNLLAKKFWWKMSGGKFLLNIFLVGNFGEKFLVENLEENAISDILEPHAFQKYSIHWVLEALCICICLCLCVFVFLHVFVLVIVITG